MYCTVFGIEREGLGYGQPLTHPLAGAANLATVARLINWPDPAWTDVSNLNGPTRQPVADDYAILGGDWSPYWHDAIDLLGMERLDACACTRTPNSSMRFWAMAIHAGICRQVR